MGTVAAVPTEVVGLSQWGTVDEATSLWAEGNGDAVTAAAFGGLR